MRLLRQWLATFLYPWSTKPDATLRVAHAAVPPVPPEPNPDAVEVEQMWVGLQAAVARMERQGHTNLWIEADNGCWMLTGYPASMFHAAIAPRPELLHLLMEMARALEAGDEHGLAACNHKFLVHIGRNLQTLRNVSGARMEH